MEDVFVNLIVAGKLPKPALALSGLSYAIGQRDYYRLVKKARRKKNSSVTSTAAPTPANESKQACG